MMLKGNEASGAIFSDCGVFRYRLWRCWDQKLPRVCFVLLNPSTADEISNDPTIERQYRRVLQWSSARTLLKFMFGDYASDLKELPPGFGSIEIVNAFALRSTDPANLYIAKDAIGPDNNAAILNATTYARGSGGIIVCGWGTHAAFGDRHDELKQFFNRHNLPVTALALNADGTPKHPLYLSYKKKPRSWDLEFGLGDPVV